MELNACAECVCMCAVDAQARRSFSCRSQLQACGRREKDLTRTLPADKKGRARCACGSERVAARAERALRTRPLGGDGVRPCRV